MSANRDIDYLFERNELLHFVKTGIKIIMSKISVCRTDNLRGMFLFWLYVYGESEGEY